MAVEWPIQRFGTLYAEPSRNGLTRPKRVRGSGVKFVNMGELFRCDRLLSPACERAPLTGRELSWALLRDGDLLFARQSLVFSGAGKCSIFLHDEEEVTFESHLIRVRLDPAKADPRFYYYYFRSCLGRVLIESIVEQGAGASGVRGSDLSRLELPVPPLAVQSRIASALSAFDDKIELNRRMSETLDEMARAIFKSWFVDFDPVRAKAAGKPTRLSPQLDRLFPSKLVPSEFGEMPEGWSVGLMDQIVSLSRASVRPAAAPGTPFLHFSIPAFDSGRMPVLDRGEDIKSNKYSVPVGSVLLSKLNPRFQRVWRPEVGAGDAAICSTEFLVCEPRDGVTREFLYGVFSSESFHRAFMGSVTGTSGSHQRVRPAAFLALGCVVPPLALIRAFDDAVSPMLDRVSNARREGQCLVELRDTLLPKLVSGELRVPDAEKFVESVT